MSVKRKKISESRSKIRVLLLELKKLVSFSSIFEFTSFFYDLLKKIQASEKLPFRAITLVPTPQRSNRLTALKV